jgi:hypothetical protein
MRIGGAPGKALIIIETPAIPEDAYGNFHMVYNARMFSPRPAPLHYCFAILMLLMLVLGSAHASPVPEASDNSPIALALDAGTDTHNADDLLTESSLAAPAQPTRLARQTKDSAAPPSRSVPPDHPPPDAA